MGDRVNDVLAVVHDQQEGFVPKKRDERVGEWAIRDFTQSDGCRDGVRHTARIRDRRQLD
jgi:hypothetical protein